MTGFNIRPCVAWPFLGEHFPICPSSQILWAQEHSKIDHLWIWKRKNKTTSSYSSHHYSEGYLLRPHKLNRIGLGLYLDRRSPGKETWIRQNLVLALFLCVSSIKAASSTCRRTHPYTHTHPYSPSPKKSRPLLSELRETSYSFGKR